jgi:phosphatidylserine/phosphatidylglycerophosphate/cardiolipin synthase-like enzyme
VKEVEPQDEKRPWLLLIQCLPAGTKQIVRRFAERFRSREWPKDGRLPEVYFDPRSLATDPVKRASMHAKCIVIDGQIVFVSSANFTEAAQERNLEIDLLIRSSTLDDHFANG